MQMETSTSRCRILASKYTEQGSLNLASGCQNQMKAGTSSLHPDSWLPPPIFSHSSQQEQWQKRDIFLAPSPQQLIKQLITFEAEILTSNAKCRSQTGLCLLLPCNSFSCYFVIIPNRPLLLLLLLLLCASILLCPSEFSPYLRESRLGQSRHLNIQLVCLLPLKLISHPQMNHQGRDIYHCGRPEELPLPSAVASAPTFDFLQVPYTPLGQFQFDPLHGVTGHAQVNFMDLQKWHLQCFWQQQMQEVENLADYKQHQLPLARIKRIMKMEGDAKMVSADTPIFFAKACELFISELAVRSWLHAEQCKRHTIRRTDVAGAICHSNVLDFLLEILHAEELQVYMRQPSFLRQQMMPQQQSYPNSNNILYEPPPPL